MKEEVIKEENILDTSKIFVGVLLMRKLNMLLDEGEISERQYMFFRSVLDFHRIDFVYAINNFPIQNLFLSTFS